MPKNAVTDWSTTAASNSDVGGNNIAEGNAPSTINNSIRELMAQIATAIANGDLIADGQVDSAKLGNLSVLEAAIGAGAVTHPKLAGGLHPIGMVVPFAGFAAPSGWLLCYGQAISRATYSALFAVCGTVYGAGDGSTTFNVPDLRGRAVAGLDIMGGVSASRIGTIGGNTLGAAGGFEENALTAAQMPSHNHFNGVGDTGSSFMVYGTTTTDVPGVATNNPSGNVSVPTFQGVTSFAGSGEAHNNIQPTIILSYMIFAGV